MSSNYEQSGLYEDYIAVSRYARYIPEKKRRETWPETVDRFVEFWEDKFGKDYLGNFGLAKDSIRDAKVNKEVMPSMRCLMASGEALRRENIAGYNCAYVAVDHIRVFGESLYIQMNGTGLGYSVERQYIQKLPAVAE